MNKIGFVLLLLALTLVSCSIFAVTVSIGTGTATTDRLPIRGNDYDYSYSQQLYTQAQINTAGTISKLRFYFSSGSTNNCNQWVVYIGHTTKSSFTSDTDWVPTSQMTQVFNGTVTFPAAGNWLEITLSPTFVYNNTDNLVIAVDENAAGEATNDCLWGSFTSTTNCSIYYRSSTTNPNPASPPTASNRYDYKNRIQLEISTVIDPSSFTATAASPSQINLSWVRNATPDNVMVAWNSTNTFGTPINGTSYSAGNAISGGGTVIYNGSGTSYSHSPLSAETTYYYRAWSVSGTTHYSIGVNANATTLSPTPVIIGTGTGSEAFPLNRGTEFSTEECIYLASEISAAGGGAGTITTIGFNKSSGSNTSPILRVTIWLKNTDLNVLSSGTFSNFGYIPVFQGSFTNSTTSGWQNVNLTQPFYYNGTSNLGILIQKNWETSITTGPVWTYTTTATTLARRVSGNGGEPATSTAYTPRARLITTNNRPNLRLIFRSFSVSPTAIAAVIPDGNPAQTQNITISNNGSSNLTITGITGATSWCTYSFTPPVTVNPGNSYVLQVNISEVGAANTASTTNPPSRTILSIATDQGTLSVPVSTITTGPLPVNPRHIAQWEPARGAIIRHNPADTDNSGTRWGIPNSLILDLAANNNELFVITSAQTTAASHLNAIPNMTQYMGKVRYINAASNTYWARDWGPISIYEGSPGQRVISLVDFDYDRLNRASDNAAIQAIAADIDVDTYTPPSGPVEYNYVNQVYYLPASLTGGNFLCDGENREFADWWAYHQNDGDTQTGRYSSSDGTWTDRYGYTHTEMTELTTSIRGHHRTRRGFLGFESPNGDYIHHLDTWIKLISPTHFIIADNIPDATIDAALDAYALMLQNTGTDIPGAQTNYSVHRVRCPASQPYINCYIINGRVHMPFSGTTAPPGSANDNARLDLQAAFDAAWGNGVYTVVGHYQRNTATAWVSTDAIHCRVNTLYLPSPNDEPPLPVELSSFTVTLSTTNQALLTWITQTETNVSGFSIYRGDSADLALASQLNVFIEATNSSQTQTYVYLDQDIWQSGTYYYWLESRDMDGSNQFYGPISITIDLIGQQTPPLELVTGIDGIYPNPFNPVTTIAYTLKNQCQAQILIYNIKGQLVRDLLNETKSPGNYRLQWDSRDNNGTPCASGLYNVVLRAGNKSYHRKAVLLK